MLSDTVQIALIAQVAPILVAIASVVGAVAAVIGAFGTFRNGRDIKVVKKATDGLVQQGRKDVGEIEHAKGVIQGKAEEQANPTSGFGALKP